jgi:hypothetical protein
VHYWGGGALGLIFSVVAFAAVKVFKYINKKFNPQQKMLLFF